MKTDIQKVKKLVKIQGQNGNWNYSDYMRGMYNGMVCILAVLEDKEPKYKKPLKEYLEHKGEHKTNGEKCFCNPKIIKVKSRRI